MKKSIFLAILAICTVYLGHTQVVTGNRPLIVKPVTETKFESIKMPTLQDTLMMLMNRVKELEEQRLPGGKKTIKVIIPAAANMCFPFQDSRFPNRTFYQGVVIDDAVCNNNPGAVLIVTVKTTAPQQSFPVSVGYDAADGKWKISLKGYTVSSLAKNVSCYNNGGKIAGVCPQSGLYNNVGVMEPVSLSAEYSNGIEFNVLISEKGDIKLPKIKRAGT